MIKAKREARVLDADQISQAIECLKVLAHPTRLKIVQLVIQRRHTVTELASACGIVGAVASAQLRLLERSGILTGQREGKFVYYQISDPRLANLIASIESCFT